MIEDWQKVPGQPTRLYFCIVLAIGVRRQVRRAHAVEVAAQQAVFDFLLLGSFCSAALRERNVSETVQLCFLVSHDVSPSVE